MISVFQVFKIIIGLIISAFILILVMQFSGSYMEIGESSRQVSILVNLKKVIEDVYTTGISTDFEMKDSEILSFRAPYMETIIAHFDVEPLPIITSAGSKFSVTRNEYDIGWWKFYFIEMLPETKIIFIPLDDKEKVWNILTNTSMYFPSTENTGIKTKIGLGCEGTDFWFGWERNRFLQKIIPSSKSMEIVFEMCENMDYFREEDYKVIIISDGSGSGEFVIIPGEDDNIGRVRVEKNGEYKYYVYKNGLDIVMIVLGGEQLYTHMNKKFISELSVAIDITTRESSLILNDYELNKRCGTEISNFRHALGQLKESIPNLNSESESSAAEFSEYIKNTEKIHRQLEMLGCV
ncbi:MAG: hypothetical protein KAS04_04730 [Candidatus Aenigmarchaeota archaeon]|nr:hypothetical protein [Candidatus Aenigmarchaeota archaeon]